MSKLEAGDVAAAKADLTASNKATANDYAKMGLAIVDAKQGHKSAAITVLTDLKQSSATPQLARAAGLNLDRVKNMASGGGDTTTSLKWLILFGGGILFAVQFYVVMRAATPGRRAGAFGLARVILGAVVGLATAAVFAWAFLYPPDSPLAVLAVLGVDVVVVALAGLTPTAARPAPRSA